VHIADDALEESFFTAGDRLAAVTSTQFEIPVVHEEDRRRGLKAILVTAAILLVAGLLLALFLPAPTSPAARHETEHGERL
jgi:ferric-dicitrate binding protein FerR (iron transport regulator)